MSEEFLRNVQLPLSLCEAAEQRFAGSFADIEKLLEFVLRELLRDDAARMDEAEQKIIEQRLRELGYL